MEINTDTYEKLGSFYLGREYDPQKKELLDSLILYDSKDLVTHGVVLGMTGSGKTGLCLALLEEAAMDNIPAIVIDPKGDIANLLLTFPDLAPADFRPWINEEDARKKGDTPEVYAEKQAALWRQGLGEWGQGPERIRKFREQVDLAVYTPGSNAGLPVSILSSLNVPEFEILDDAELFSERIESTVSSLLSLIGIEADPIQDPRHILLSNIFSHDWRAGLGVALETLIRHIQVPPFDKIGVLDLERVCPEKDRQDLAMKMNNLLASPGFSTWLQGDPLNVQRMLYTAEGKPRISIFSIAHLGDTERMFFVSLLLNQMLGWMRSQSGTTSLRALLYMDEIYGYLPPTANPPSKKPMMTLLKQARAFGLGVLLATQNPVDLDYKALSNIGTWFLGRLQTERDKMRVLDGLQGAAVSNDAGFDRKQMEQLLAGLGARIFLMNNVHEDAPVVFHVRWVMSYLRGPLARAQIKALMDPRRATVAETPAQAAASAPAAQAARPPEKPRTARPRLPRDADEYFLPTDPAVPAEEIHYLPAVIRIGEARFSDASKKIQGQQVVVILNHFLPESGEIDWAKGFELPGGRHLSQLARDPLPGAGFGKLPPQSSLESKTWKAMKKDLVDWLYNHFTVTIYQSPLTGMYSNIGETEGEFRARLMHAAREIRDRKVADLRESYRKKMATRKNRIASAKDEVAEQQSQASSAMDTAVRIGLGILGAVLGRSASRSRSSAISGASRAWKESRDVSRAREKMEDLKDSLADLERECAEEVRKLETAMDPMAEKLEEIRLSPYKKNCFAKSVGIIWLPYRAES